MQSVLWIIPVVAAVLVVAVALAVVVRRREGEGEESAVFPRASGEDSGAQVRLLEGDGTARQARIEALRSELGSLRREVAYAEQRGLDRRAERLEELIAEREEQLRQHDPAGDRSG